MRRNAVAPDATRPSSRSASARLATGGAADAEDHVALVQAGARGGAARLDRGDHGAVGVLEPELARDLRRHVLRA